MKTKNVVTRFAALGLAAVLLAGCGSSGSSPSSSEAPVSESTEGVTKTADSEETWEISVSTPNAESAINGKWLAWFVEEVNTRTDGRMTINPFYSNTLGDQKDMFTQLSNGEIEMILDGTVSVDYYAPDYGFLTAPYMVQGTSHMEALIDSPVFDGFKAELKENNIGLIATGMRSSRNLLSSDKIKFNGLENISQLVIRVPDLETYVTAWQNLGASTQIMGGGEVYSSMQTGVINATEAPYDQMVADKYYEVGAYVYNTEHVTEFYGMYVSESWFESLPEDIQTILTETAQEAMDSAKQESFETAEADLQQLVDSGIEYVEIDTAELVEKLAPVWQEKFESVWTGSTYDEVVSYAK